MILSPGVMLSTSPPGSRAQVSTMSEPYDLHDRNPSRRQRQRGSTLLEAMIGALIVAIISIQMIAFFARGRQWFDQEEHKRVATLIAQEALEQAASADYVDVVPWTKHRTVAGIRYETTVTVLNNVPETDMKTVRVVVSWPATATSDRTVSISTSIYDN
jgi:type II secretory pathway pseudopilin PulG